MPTLTGSPIISWTDFLRHLPLDPSPTGGPSIARFRVETVLLGPQSGKYGPYYVLRISSVPGNSQLPKQTAAVRVGESTIKKFPELLNPNTPVIELEEDVIKQALHISDKLKERKTIRLDQGIPDSFTYPEGQSIATVSPELTEAMQSDIAALEEAAWEMRKIAKAPAVNPSTTDQPDPVGDFIAYMKASMDQIRQANSAVAKVLTNMNDVQSRRIDVLEQRMGEIVTGMNIIANKFQELYQGNNGAKEKEDLTSMISLLNDNLMAIQGDLLELKNLSQETRHEHHD